MTTRLIALALLVSAQAVVDRMPAELPSAAVAQLAKSLAAAKAHGTHLWRDTTPINADGTINGYIEIARGDRRKWEFDMARHARAIDRFMPDEVGGYPVNYGFVPQTVSYDGDPFDVLVLGPPIDGGQLVRGVAVGLMYMEDEKGLDAKVVLSPLDADGRPQYALTDRDRAEIGEFFRRYKRHETGKFSNVPGWGTAADGLAHVSTTHAFFQECRSAIASPCRLRKR
jgi:inorganic pyrophosphatase